MQVSGRFYYTNLHKIYSVKISMLKFLDGESPVTLATLNMALSSR